MMIEASWLGALLIGLVAWTVHGNRQYASFRELTESKARVACYLRWTVESFVILTGASVITLMMLGRPDAPFAMPDLFHPIAAHVSGDAAAEASAGTLPFLIGLAVGVGLLVAIQYFRLRRVVEAISGDVEPLLPRNARERLAIVPLSLNAGFSEELFFRLALPLLVAEVSGSAAIGFAVAVAAFGLAHAYQGWKGVVGTTLFGIVFTLHYLQHGSLLWLMAAHALIDLVALIVRPLVATRFAGSRRAVAA
jgi:uncharacterized protein